VRVAALCDIHGNLHALDAVLGEARELGVDAIVVGGDVVAGPFPRETFDRLAALGDLCVYVRGNADREVCEAGDEQSRWCREQLGERVEIVRAWPLTTTIDGILFCHATPRSDDEIVTRITPDERVAEAFDGTPFAIVGHTHVQFDRRVHGTRVVNAGSVGWPYEGTPGARWALLDGDVTLRTTAYDVVAAADAVRATGFPGAGAAASELVAPSTAEAATQHFESLRGA
jgi:putative phosphoesterase